MSHNTLFKIARTMGVLVLVFVAVALFLVPPTMAQGPKPPAPKDSVSISATKEMDALVLELAKALNLTDVAYDAYRSPADTVWEDTYKYYAEQMAQAGWSGQGATREIKGGKVGVWVNAKDNTMLVLMYIAPTKEDPATYEFAIKGKISDKPVSGTPKLTPLTDSVSVTATPEMDTLVNALTRKLNMTEVKYEAWRSPASTVWEETLKYYSDQMAQAGWGGQGLTQDFDGGKIGVWINQETKTALVLIFIAPTQTDTAVYEIAVFGKMAGIP